MSTLLWIVARWRHVEPDTEKTKTLVRYIQVLKAKFWSSQNIFEFLKQNFLPSQFLCSKFGGTICMPDGTMLLSKGDRGSKRARAHSTAPNLQAKCRAVLPVSVRISWLAPAITRCLTNSGWWVRTARWRAVNLFLFWRSRWSGERTMFMRNQTAWVNFSWMQLWSCLEEK